MTDARSPETPEAGDPPTEAPTDAAAEPSQPEVPAPEPWTPRKVAEWNAYYDLYVALAVLLVGFLGSANRLTNSAIWTHLQAGRALSSDFAPTADPFSYSQPGHRWVHITWLSDLAHYQLFNLVSGLIPPDPQAAPKAPAAPVAGAEPTEAPNEAGEQWGVAGLIALDSLARALTILVLLRARHRGPGLWWSALCTGLALAVLPVPFLDWQSPIAVRLGGIGGLVEVGSASWGHLFLAIELLWIFRASDQGRPRLLFALVPLFLVWANVDGSFLIGLIVLAAASAGLAMTRRVVEDDPSPTRSTPRTAWIVLAASAAVCLANPSIHRIYPAALASIVPIPGWSPGPLRVEDTSFLKHLFSGKTMLGDDVMVIYFLTLVGVGYASFALNRRRFSAPRLVVYTVAVVLWALVRRYSVEFAEVFALVVALNGQEWYHDAFGTEGRLGRGWATWSIGGRAATIGVLGIVLVARVILGRGAVPGEPQFGFGFEPGAFAFEAAELVRDAPIRGNVLNTWLDEGDALVWRAYPKRKSFIDSRRHLFGEDVIAKVDALRKAIRDDDVDAWKPVLDEYEASAVMVDVDIAPTTYQTLLGSRNWVRFYDDGDHALFGRSDAPAEDLAYFRRNELDVENLAYKNPTPPPSNMTPPSSSNELGWLYAGRSRAQPHTLAAMRWLRPPDVAANTPFLPDPGRCLLAIRDARRALYVRHESAAYRQLADAYNALLAEESAMILGIEPTPANVEAIGRAPLQVGLLAGRYRQFVTALHFAVTTYPTPKEAEDRLLLANLNLRLAQAFFNQGALDLARDRLDVVLQLGGKAGLTAEQYADVTKQLTGLNKQLDDVRKAVTNLGIETQAGPVQKAGMARQYGAVGLAIQLLEEARDGNVNPALINPTLLDLYCQVGEPDKAGELWQSGNFADRTLGDGPGTAAMRQGRVFFLLGNYESALAVWTREAIPVIRGDRTLGATMSVRSLLDGEPTAATRKLLEIPEEIATQAGWEFEIGMASLEAGRPVVETADHLTNALKLAPNTAVRPVIAYYLKKLGQPVPDAPAVAGKAARPSAVPVPSIVAPPGAAK